MAHTTPHIDTHTGDHDFFSSNPSRVHDCPKKRIIIACDGTWMDSDGQEQTPSNVTRIVRAIPPIGVDYSDPTTSKPINQVTFYQNGIGTGGNTWFDKHLGKFITGATGEGLASNIREAYSFLCSNYHRGDEIILLGFSRGAFTARSISTLVRQLGLLTPKGLSYLVDICEDWEQQNIPHYKSTSEEPWPNRPSFASQEYHDKLHQMQLTRRNIPIKCVAVWDTVGALGLPMVALFPQPKTKEFAFVDTRCLDNVEYCFHALGLDERRRSYAPTIWTKPRDQQLPRVLKQTWFPGVHSDVGGSYPNDDMANITLAWMVGQFEEHGLITFNREYLFRQVHRTLHQHEKAYLADSTSTPRTLARAATFGPVRDWGLGKIHDSYTLFFRIGGAQTRTPMEHPEVSKTTMQATGNYLTDTNEYMHACVRVRMALDGLGYDDKGKYISSALKGWDYNWKLDANPNTPFQVSQPGEVGAKKGVEWVKRIKRKLENGKEINDELRMAEDTMTEFERLVLRHWTTHEDNWEDGADQREDIIYSARPKRRETSKSLESPGTAKSNVQSARKAYGMDAVGEANGGQQGVMTNGHGEGHQRGLHVTTNV